MQGAKSELDEPTIEQHRERIKKLRDRMQRNIDELAHFGQESTTEITQVKAIDALLQERDKLIRILKCSGPGREICAECSEVSRVGFAVPNDIWKQVVGNENILCLRCFTRKADFMYVEWDKDIQFFPVSKVTHRECADSWYKELSEKDELIKTLEAKLKDCDKLWKDAVHLLQSGDKEDVKKYLGEVHNSCPGCGDHLGQCGCAVRQDEF